MSATKSGAQRGARTVYADITGCVDCVHVRKTKLFTICEHRESHYRVAEHEDFHTVQYMRDSFVGRCGDEMRLKEPK